MTILTVPKVHFEYIRMWDVLWIWYLEKWTLTPPVIPQKGQNCIKLPAEGRTDRTT